MSTGADAAIADLAGRRSSKWSTFGPDVLPAHVAETDLDVAPVVRDAICDRVRCSDLGYAGAEQPHVGPAFSAFASRRLGWTPDPDRVALLPDVMAGVAELLRVLLAPGTPVIVTPPVYPPFFAVPHDVGCPVVEVPLGADGSLDPDGIERAFAAGAGALLLSNPHNPTGRVATEDELVAIAAAAERHGAWVLADEIWAPLVLRGARHRPFATVSDAAAERGLVLCSASKAFNVAGLKAAVLATASEAAHAAVAKLPPELHYRASILGVVATETAFREGDAWLDDLLVRLADRRDELGALLRDRLPGARCAPYDAGYLAWLDLRAWGLDDPAATILERGRVALSPGPHFGTGGAGFARLNAGTTPELLAEAVERIRLGLGEA